MAADNGRSGDALGIAVTEHLGPGDGGRETGALRIEKWDLDQIAWARGRNRDFFDPRREPDARWFTEFGVRPVEVAEFADTNLITGAGWARCLNNGGWLGTAATLFSATVGRVGLGQGLTAATYSDTALTTASGWTGGNWQLNGATPTYATASGGTGATMIFLCTFGTGAFSANLITEFAVDQGTAASGANVTASVAPMVNHGVNASGYGTKTSSQTWNITVTLTFT